METNNGIKLGEWICTWEGIGIAERIHDFYYEEYDDEIPDDKKIGDYHLSALEYKLFCDYDGKPRRRNRFKMEGLEYCSPLEDQYKGILEKSIKDHPKEYASFVKFLSVPKQTNELCWVFYKLTEENMLQAGKDMATIQKTLPKKFTYADVLKIASDINCVVDLTKNPPPYMDRNPIYLQIIMGYTLGDFKGKRVLFHSFHYEVVVRDKRFKEAD